MDRILRALAKFGLAALFGAVSTSAIFATAATQAGSPVTGFLSAAPSAALADRDDRRFRRYGYHNHNYGYWQGGRFFITIAYSNQHPYYQPNYYQPVYYPTYRHYDRDDRRRYDRDDRRRYDRDDRNRHHDRDDRNRRHDRR